MLSSIFAQTTISAAAQDIRLALDGQTLDSDVAPYITSNNVTMVPLRVISNGLGASVDWQQATETVIITGNGTQLMMSRGDRSALVNGSPVALDSAVQTRNGRVMVPLRFIGETLGLQVDWNASTRWITLQSGSGQGSIAPSLPGNTANPSTDSGSSRPTPSVQASSSMRGAWVATVNGDWPSASAKNSAQKQRQEFTALLDDLQAMGINAVFVQVRASGDAIYTSKLVPWSRYLTNTQGKDPGYDPLAFMIEETHARGMEFHAWFNPFRANTTSAKTGLASNHVVNEHPNWIVNTGSQLYINPGIPQARQHIIDAIMEVVNNYDIDGVHLDDYFYPYSGSFNDDATYKESNGVFSNKGDWRRNNINVFVKELGASIHASKPKVEFGISPFGVWRNKSVDITGSNTKAGVTAYDTTFADVRTWIKQEYIDYVVPQVYWSIGFAAAPYDTLVSWWAGEVKGTKVKLYIGHAPYKLGTPEKGWQTAQQIIDQLAWNESYPEVKGDIFFSAQHLRKNPLGLSELLKSYYQ
nr:family 10 glycosylhydrolase [Paenibacillus massiliensis]